MPYYNIVELTPYFKGEMKYEHYKEADEKYQCFLPHSDGVYPKELIEIQRPNEPDYVKEYRKQIWVPITTPTFSRVISSLQKIRRSSDWGAKYPEEEFTKIATGETLEEYCEKGFPYFKSVTNWLFALCLKQYCIDANAVILVIPLNIGDQENKYLKPFPYVFNCCDVIQFQEEQIAILRDQQGCEYKTEQGNTMKGKSFWVVTPTTIEKYNQVDAKENYALVSEYAHGLPEMPAFKVGGVINTAYNTSFCYKSRIADMLPDLNEAITEYTDLQAGMRLHIYPERWEFAQNECRVCSGLGKLANPNYRDGDTGQFEHIPCGNCGGSGIIPSGPFSKIIVKQTQAGENPIPLPPAGFVEKDVEIIKIMKESISGHKYDALAAINFQFLDQAPLNTSGYKTEVDKEELNNTVHSIAEDIVAIIDRFYKFCAYYRYAALYPFSEIDRMVPSVPVPEHFDLLSSQFMQEEIKKAKEAKLNPLIVSEMEIEYTGKRFINEPEVRDRVALILNLDPLGNISEDDKMSRLSNKGILQSTYIISSNIQEFIQRALDEEDDFASWELEKQKEKMLEYAKEIEDSNSVEKELLQPPIDPLTGLPIEEDANIPEDITAN